MLIIIFLSVCETFIEVFKIVFPSAFSVTLTSHSIKSSGVSANFHRTTALVAADFPHFPQDIYLSAGPCGTQRNHE